MLGGAMSRIGNIGNPILTDKPKQEDVEMLYGAFGWYDNTESIMPELNPAAQFGDPPPPTEIMVDGRKEYHFGMTREIRDRAVMETIAQGYIPPTREIQ